MQEERERSKEYLMDLRTGKSKTCQQVLSGKESTCQCRRHRLDPRVGKIPWKRKWQPIPVMGFSVQYSLVTQSCLTLCDPMGYTGSTPGFPVHHQLPELAQTQVHQVGDTIQPSHPLSPRSPPTFNHFQHQGLFQWGSSLHHVAKVLELQLQHQSFKWIFRVGFL